MNGAQDERRLPAGPPLPVSREHRDRIIALPICGRRLAVTGRHIGDHPPELVAEIHTVDGPDAERLTLQQARVLREVIAWMAHNTGAHTSNRAA